MAQRSRKQQRKGKQTKSARVNNWRAARQELLSLKQANGLLRPTDVVETARNPGSALHGHFEWDDSAAAERYRLNQAREIISRFELTVVHTTTTYHPQEFVHRPGERLQGYNTAIEIRRSSSASRDYVAQQLRLARSIVGKAVFFAEPIGFHAEVIAIANELGKLAQRVQAKRASA